MSLSTEYYYHCLTAERYSSEVASGDKTYRVLLDDRSHKYTGEVDFDWSCTCPDYKFNCGPDSRKNRRYCKHIKQVQSSDDYCGWMQYESGGEVAHDDEGEPCCPECGGPVTSTGWAV